MFETYIFPLQYNLNLVYMSTSYPHLFWCLILVFPSCDDWWITIYYDGWNCLLMGDPFSSIGSPLKDYSLWSVFTMPTFSPGGRKRRNIRTSVLFVRIKVSDGICSFCWNEWMMASQLFLASPFAIVVVTPNGTGPVISSGCTIHYKHFISAPVDRTSGGDWLYTHPYR